MAKAKSNSDFQSRVILHMRSGLCPPRHPKQIAFALFLITQLFAISSFADEAIPQVIITGERPNNLRSELEQQGARNQAASLNLLQNRDQPSQNVIIQNSADVVGQTGQGGANGKGSDQAKGSTQNKDNKKVGDGRCDASHELGKACQDTYDWIENAQLANQISTAAGSTVVNATGQVGAIKAQSAGTQSAVMQAAANTQQSAGELKTTIGLANTAMGAYQIMLSRDHKKIGEQDLTSEMKASQDQSSQGGAATADLKTYKQAIGEQKNVERAAMKAGVMSIITGVRDTVAGALAIASAKQSKDLANKLQDATGSSYQLTSANPDTLTSTAGQTTAINPGTATDPAVATTDGTVKASDVPNISPPINPDLAAGGPGAGPAAGTFQGGNPPNAPGGGSGGNIGVGAPAAAKNDPEPSGPKMADFKSNTAYGQGGSGYAAAGGVSAEKSADLGFLANLLPKPQEEMGKNGILDYGVADRSPASMAAPYSFLGKDVNIFQRISDRTSIKARNCDVGGSECGS